MLEGVSNVEKEASEKIRYVQNLEVHVENQKSTLTSHFKKSSY